MVLQNPLYFCNQLQWQVVPIPRILLWGLRSRYDEKTSAFMFRHFCNLSWLWTRCVIHLGLVASQSWGAFRQTIIHIHVHSLFIEELHINSVWQILACCEVSQGLCYHTVQVNQICTRKSRSEKLTKSQKNLYTEFPIVMDKCSFMKHLWSFLTPLASTLGLKM